MRGKSIAIKTSHNVIIMHASLTQIPDIGFFVSPLPLHLAAITIIYGQSCGFTTISYETGYEDVHSALHVTPALRWQWERKDAGGGVHPITIELANRVFKRKPPVTDQPKSTSVFMPEEDWEDDVGRSLPSDAQLGRWPNELFLPGPAWPNHHQIPLAQLQDGSGSSKSASPIGQPAIPGSLPGSMSLTNGQHSPNAALAAPAMPGANTSYFKTEEVDLTGIFAQVPEYAYGAINFQPEPELQEFFMQEEKDPMATLGNGYKTGFDMRMMERLQHMVCVVQAPSRDLLTLVFIRRVTPPLCISSTLQHHHSLVRERRLFSFLRSLRGHLHSYLILSQSLFLTFFSPQILQ
jgi:hypothetical protein